MGIDIKSLISEATAYDKKQEIEKLPDYPERAVTESISNSIIHRDYLQMGSEVHIDMYDDRIEIYSPGGMFDGSLIQNLDPLTVPSKRRNPLLADFFTRLNLMERRGSGMRKIIEAYKQYEQFANCPPPSFRSKVGEFHVTLWNQNYGKEDVVKEFANKDDKFAKKFANESKKFAKASRHIYKMISQNPRVNTAQMAEVLHISTRQVQKYLKKLQDSEKISRSGNRLNGEWRIIDKEYNIFD